MKDWRDRAACKGKTAVMFPLALRDVRHGLVYCKECPVKAQCAALGEHEPFGIWGGLSATQRGYPDGHRRPYRRRMSA